MHKLVTRLWFFMQIHIFLAFPHLQISSERVTIHGLLIAQSDTDFCTLLNRQI